MYLKSLTLKGFKSFAQSTTMHFEPGICAIVGPNGSGKSNVVDALTWVMGEQGAKALRGGKMEDVIFAGTSTRPALGRAEVTLTFDNSDNSVPLDFTEVSITRRMFRDGASEYEINGTRCRLMDVQELLSDSGIGREMHVIVGQGKLSDILESRPEERRAYIEEAAGVRKHRRRKDSAVKKLAGMQGNVDRLQDLTRELGRQLGPLSKQAALARRAQGVQAELRDAKQRLAAEEITLLRRESAAMSHRLEAATTAAAAIADSLAAADEQLAAAQAHATAHRPAVEAITEVWLRAQAHAERLAATARIATERAEAMDTSVQPLADDPEEMRQRAARLAREEQDLHEAVITGRTLAEQAAERLTAATSAAMQASSALRAAQTAAADRREGQARLAAQIEAAEQRVETIDADLVRLREEQQVARQRSDEVTVHAEQVRAHAQEGISSTAELAQRTAATAAERDRAKSHLDSLRGALRAAERQTDEYSATIAALEATKTHTSAASVLAEITELTQLADILAVTDGLETAVAAALGAAAQAQVSLDETVASRALAALDSAGQGRGVILTPTPAAGSWRLEADLPADAHWLLDSVIVPADFRAAFHGLLVDVVVVSDTAAGRQLVAADPRLRAVTPAGHLIGPGWVAAGHGQRSALEIDAEITAVRTQLAAADTTIATLTGRVAGAETAFDDARGAAQSAKLEEKDATQQRTRAQQEVERADAAVQAAQAAAQRLVDRRDELEQQRRDQVDYLTQARSEQAADTGDASDPAALDPLHTAHDEAQTELNRRREEEMSARLSVRTQEERYDAVRGRADALLRAAAHAEEAARLAERKRLQRVRTQRRAREIAQLATQAGERVALLREQLQQRRAEVQLRAEAADTQMRALAQQQQSLRAQAATHTTEVHRLEMELEKLRLRVEQAETSAVEDFKISADELVVEFGPEVPVPPTAQQLAEYEDARERGEQIHPPQPRPYHRAEQLARRKRAEKDLQLMGRVNPLALEEYAALQQRHDYLAEQLDDVLRARKDLQQVIHDVDDKIEHLFSSAWRDVEAEFPRVFATLFPGGEGRLVLTDPDNMLLTGIDVEARPPGKKVKRLSLLSGGEKSLTALALLVAIFRARPSPFYLMDEVEAALDDTNLRRLLALFEQMRTESQLIVITHQKPTMDIANVLYGVAMQGDGVTRVLSQRMREKVASAVVPEPPSSAAAAD